MEKLKLKLEAKSEIKQKLEVESESKEKSKKDLEKESKKSEESKQKLEVDCENGMSETVVQKTLEDSKNSTDIKNLSTVNGHAGESQSSKANRTKIIQETETKMETESKQESETESKIEKETETELVLKLESSSVPETLSAPVLRTLSQALLWDCQLERCKLEDSLVFIQKAISALIMKHGRIQQESVTKEQENNTMKVEDTSIDSVRRNSGEYCKMEGIVEKKKPHEEIPQSPIKSVHDSPLKTTDGEKTVDEYVEMVAPVIEDNIKMETFTVATVTADDIVLVEDSGKAQEAAEDYGMETAAKDLGKGEVIADDSVLAQDFGNALKDPGTEANNKTKEIEKNMEQIQVEVHEEDTPIVIPGPPSPVLRILESSLPLDEQFNDYSLAELTTRQAAIADRLQQLNPQVTFTNILV